MKMSNKIILFIISILLGSALSPKAISLAQENHDTNMKAIFEQHAFEKEGGRLEEIGQYDAAVEMYGKALAMEEKLPLQLRGRVIFYITGALQAESKYQDALDRLKANPYRNPKHEYGNDRILELEALVQYQKNGEPKPVYEFIEQYKKRHEKFLPPVACDPTEITTILRLYDTIGDYDKGIEVVDECLEFIYKQHPDLKKVINSEEAEKLIPREKDPNRVIRDYYRVREAFEQDKRDGTKGRATKALIQSDYFPW